MSFVVRGPLCRSLVADGKGEDVLPAWVWDCEMCGEPAWVRALVEGGVPVCRRVRIAVRMGRVSRVAGEMSGAAAEELGAWEAVVGWEVEKEEAGGV
jgi:hypothetical protein